MAQYIKLKRSSQVIEGSPKLPTAQQLEVGEIAINFAAGHETLSTLNSSSGVATFSSDSVLDSKYISSGAVVSAVTDIEKMIEEDEFVVATAVNKFKNDISSLWDSVPQFVPYDVAELSDESGLLPTEVTIAASGFTKNALTAYTESDPVFTGSPAYGITSQNISDWNAKQDAISDLAEIRSNAASGFSVLNTVLYHTGNTAAHLPEVTSADNGKILKVVDGAWALSTPSALYNGSGLPNNQLGNNGDIYIQTA